MKLRGQRFGSRKKRRRDREVGIVEADRGCESEKIMDGSNKEQKGASSSGEENAWNRGRGGGNNGM